MFRNDRQSGFTILEALVAFALLSLVLMALYPALSDSMRRIERASLVTQAILVAQSQSDLLRAQRLEPVWNTERRVPGGPFSVRFEKREQDVLNTDSAGGVALFAARIVVSWTEAGTKRSHALETLFTGRARPGAG